MVYACELSNITFRECGDAIQADLCHVEASLKGNAVVGFGSAATRELAMVKATHELAERYVCRKVCANDPTTHSSNGFAAHIDRYEAAKTARQELIERDLLLSLWLSKRPPFWLTTFSDLPKSHQVWLSGVVEQFYQKDLSVQFGILGKVGADIGVIAVLRPVKEQSERFGFVIACSVKDSLYHAIESCVIDLCRIATMIDTRSSAGGQSVFKCDFTEEHLIQPKDHIEYYLNPSRVNNAEWFFENSAPILELPAPQVNFTFYPFQLEGGWPVYVVRATASDIQQYFAGKTVDVHLNHTRLRSVFNSSSINLDPHPLG